MNDPRSEISAHFARLILAAQRVRITRRAAGKAQTSAFQSALDQLESAVDQAGAFLQEQAAPFPGDRAKLNEALKL